MISTDVLTGQDRIRAAGGHMVRVDLNAIGCLWLSCTLARRPGCDVRVSNTVLGMEFSFWRRIWP